LECGIWNEGILPVFQSEERSDTANPKSRISNPNIFCRQIEIKRPYDFHYVSLKTIHESAG
jgi:hypothetical protein